MSRSGAGYVASADELKNDPAATSFKKDEQTIGRPPVTDHDINEEYMRNAPDNLAGARRQKDPGLKEGAYETTEPSTDETADRLGQFDASTGRDIRAPYQSIDAESTSVHPNNPPQ